MDRADRIERVLFRAADLPLEVVILVIGGMAMLIAGFCSSRCLRVALLLRKRPVWITSGHVCSTDYNTGENAVWRFAQVETFGCRWCDGRCYRIITCFIPNSNLLPRILLFLCLGPGSLLLLVGMCTARDKFRAWVSYGGIFCHLILECSLTYMFSMFVAALLWRRDLLSTPTAAAVLLLYGAAILYLAGVLTKIYGRYLSAKKPHQEDAGLSTDQSMILLMGVFMLLLGVLLIPVSLGLLPFSGSAQLGLLMVIFAVQMLASGSTPIGPFPRTWLMIVLGLLFAALGIVSCIIPEILVSSLTVLVGVLNILGGVIALVKILLPRFRQSDEPHGPVQRC